ENLADDIVKELELYEERLKESEQKLIQAKEEVNKPFEQEERLSYLYKRKIELDYNVENGIITEVKEDDNVIEETTNFYDFKNMSVAEIKETFKKGMLIKLENMQGENLPSGLLGAVERVDDIGQVKVIWQNGSTLSLNVKEDSFEIISNENTKENEYTQNEEIYEEEMWEEIQ
ncbi:DUF4314 domain-containing protein, partial [uncultured Tyzzerella sp.]|uniref:DUF4314 domain-containing protein n=1 Tax=uncultured Tyzzerella sp. TaxID=2321398 RepID=UPI002941BF88